MVLTLGQTETCIGDGSQAVWSMGDNGGMDFLEDFLEEEGHSRRRKHSGPVKQRTLDRL